MNAENDTCELTEAELDLVAGGTRPATYDHSYDSLSLLIDALVTFEPWIKIN